MNNEESCNLLEKNDRLNSWSTELRLKQKEVPAEAQQLETISSYLSEVGTRGCMYRGCTCLRYVIDDSEDREAASKALLQFAKLEKKLQQVILIERIKASYFFAKTLGQDRSSFTLAAKNGTERSICEPAFRLVYRYGEFAFRSLQKHAQAGTYPLHGLVGKRGNKAKKFDQVSAPKLKHFFENTLLPLSGPRPTCFVRDEVSNSERDNDDTIELDPEWTKRRLYSQLLYNHGMIVVKTTTRGKISLMERKDIEWITSGDEDTQLCSWFTFCSYWKKFYPNLVVRKPSEDICGMCYEFHMSSRNNKTKSSDTASSDYLMNSVEEDAEENMIDEEEETVSAWADMADKQEEKLLAVAKHIEEAKSMRMMANKAMKDAKECKENGVDEDEMDICFVADYAQNLSLPYFGSVQPGETYYYTPKTIPLFGVVDCAPKEELLHAYIYEEDDGGKGGNNVASLLMKHLSDYGYLDKTKTKKKLTLIMDNCSGQNKNRMVLRLPSYLVEMGYFREVHFLFLVVGHTKNIADRLFNVAKMLYRKTNVFVMDQLVKNMIQHKQIVPHLVDWKVFKDYDKYLSTFYTPTIKSGVKKWQVFRSSQLLGIGKLECWSSNLPDKEIATEILHKRGISSQDRLGKMATAVPSLYSTRPGLKEIKQCELYNKYRPLVPEEFRDILCPKPADGVLARDKRRRQVKAADTRERKRTTGDRSHL